MRNVFRCIDSGATPERRSWYTIDPNTVPDKLKKKNCLGAQKLKMNWISYTPLDSYNFIFMAPYLHPSAFPSAPPLYKTPRGAVPLQSPQRLYNKYNRSSQGWKKIATHVLILLKGLLWAPRVPKVINEMPQRYYADPLWPNII